MTAQRAADLERQAIRAYVRRRFTRTYGSGERGYQELEVILDWLDERAKRCNRRKGGLGKRK